MLRLAIIWTLVVGTAAAAPAVGSRGNYRLTVVGADAAEPGLRTFMVRGEDHLRQVFRIGAPQYRLRVEIGGNRRYALGDLLVWGLPASAPPHRRRHELLRALLARRLVRSPADAETVSDTVPDWIIAALNYQLERRYDRALPPGCYPILRALHNADRLPQPTALAALPPPLDKPWLYGVYAENCAGLLTVLRRDEEETPLGLLRAAAAGTSPADAVSDQLPRKRIETDKLQQWYIDEIDRLAVNEQAPRSYAAVARAIADLELVPVLAPEQPGGIRRVPIEDVGLYLQTYAADGRYTGALMAAVLGLLTDSPPLLQEPLRAYLQALGNLDTNEQEAFAESIRAAREQLTASVSRGQAIDQWVADVAAEVRAPGQRLRQPWAAIAADQPPASDFGRDLDAWLDAIEAPSP